MSEHRNSEASAKGRAQLRHIANMAYGEGREPVKLAHALGVLNRDSQPVEPFVADSEDKLPKLTLRENLREDKIIGENIIKNKFPKFSKE